MKKTVHRQKKPAVFSVAQELEVLPPGGDNAVTLSQTAGLTVYNVTDIPSCASDGIELRQHRFTLRIEGQDLMIEKFDAGTVTVHGTLLSVSFVQGEAFVC